MVVKFKSFDTSGKAVGPALILWDDEVRFANIRREANGGVTLIASKEDEFGHEDNIEITIDKIDFEQLKSHL